MYVRRISTVIITLSVLTACDPNMGSNQQMGTLFGGLGGGAIGGVLGNALGGHNRGVSTVLGASLGAVAGALVGGEVGRSLDTKDQQRASQATVQALNTGGTHTWKSDHSGASGRVSVEKTQKTASGECRSVREVAYVRGQEVQQDNRYCRNGRGEWEQA